MRKSTTIHSGARRQLSAAAAALLSLAVIAAHPAELPAAANKPKCFGKKATLVVTTKKAKGTKGRDVIVIKRKQGATVNARGGNDLICGSKGTDVINGGAGNDKIKGGPGNDKLQGGAGNDRILGGPGNDRLLAGKGRDVLLGQQGSDRFKTKPGSARTDAKPGEIVDGKRKQKPQAPIGSGSIERISIAFDGAEADGMSSHPSISADGRYVAFDSEAENLVAGDANHSTDVFVYDRASGITELVSKSSAGVQGDDSSGYPVISADGRYVLFTSFAKNWGDGPAGGGYEALYLRDRQEGTTERVDLGASGVPAKGYVYGYSISADGRYVAFSSDASGLVAGDTPDEDVYVRDRQEGTTERVSLTTYDDDDHAGSISPSISADGRYVAFTSHADDLVAGDGNEADDVFVYDRQSGETERISVPDDPQEDYAGSGNPSISADGRYVAFESSGLLTAQDRNSGADIYVHDRLTGEMKLASVSTRKQGYTYWERKNPAISAGGRHVAFVTRGGDIVPGDNNERWDVFVRDLEAKTTAIASVSSSGFPGNKGSWSPSLSGDGRYVAFDSEATNLVPGDTNGWDDVFVHDREG